jgi:hypothetical protein
MSAERTGSASHVIATAGKAAAIADAARAGGKRGLPPVERWNPPYCGEIDMRIAWDGSWHYQGTPIGRPALVRLFSTVLRKDPERYVLVTPVERVGITVEDVPFLAVEMRRDGEGNQQVLHFTTNLGDEATAGPEHPMRFVREAEGGYRPYVHVRGGLEARLTRTLYLEIVALAEVEEIEGEAMLALRSGGAVFAIAPATELGDAR